LSWVKLRIERNTPSSVTVFIIVLLAAAAAAVGLRRDDDDDNDAIVSTSLARSVRLAALLLGCSLLVFARKN
jgi:hypothetical protein